MKNSNGKIPFRTSIYRYFNDPFYYGLSKINKGQKNEREIDFRNITAPDGTPFTPAWTEEDFWQYQRRNRGDIPKPKSSKLNHPLRGGFVRCGRDGEHAMYAVERSIKVAGGKRIKQLGYEKPNGKLKQVRVKAEIIFEAIAKDLEGGLGLTRKEQIQFQTEAVQYAVKHRHDRKFKRKRLTETTALNERDLEQLEIEKAALVRHNEYDKDARKRIEDRKKQLKKELQSYQTERKAIDREFEEDMFTFKTFLELSVNADEYWLKANHVEKHKIAEIMLLNLIVEGREVRSITYKSPFAEWIKRRKIHTGREECTKLEPLLQWLFDYIEREPEVFKPIVDFQENVACQIVDRMKATGDKRLATRRLNLNV